jgi:asparagine synthase (glutamine-hydrolysing)
MGFVVMCGICGIIDFKGEPINPIRLQKMMVTMKHRGPDDEGVFVEGAVGLGFVRLSIIDLSPAGHQPMVSHDGRFVIVFNGEVYNYIELRDELKKEGYICNTRSDTEVLLMAYDMWGENCLARFNGMWSFVIYDRVERKLFCARDRFGIKPFYYYIDNKELIFGSEIPPILAVLKKARKANEQVICDYLVFNRTDQSENTFFEGIKKLQHGCKFTLDLKLAVRNDTSIPQVKWYRLSDNLNKPFHSPEEFYQTLRSSIGLQLRSDVPIGVCLSGGLDSSSIVSILLTDFKKADLNTFSAVYGSGLRGDERKYLALFRPLLRNMYFVTPTAESLCSDLSAFVKAHGEPVTDSSPYAQFKVMEAAKGKVTVLLDGQGADEMLAGYMYLFGFYFKELICSFRLIDLLKECYYYRVNHRSWYAFKILTYLLLPRVLKENFKRTTTGYINKEFVGKYMRSNVVVSELYNSSTLREALVDHFEYKLEHLLKWEDRNSMWFSLESRVPFLDFRLVEQTISLSTNWLIRNGMTKYIMRESMKGILSEDIRCRKDKIGFETPEDDWFRQPVLARKVGEIINSRRFRQRGYYDLQKTGSLFKRHLENGINAGAAIWRCLNMELWFDVFID